MEPTSPSLRISSSSSDEVLTESQERHLHTRMLFLSRSRAMLNLPRYSTLADTTFKDLKKLPDSIVRCNSLIDPVEILDTCDVPLSKLRRNSCSCEACGGQKLARKYMNAAIPKAEVQHKDFAVSGIKSLANLIRNYKKEDLLEFPGLTTIRMSLMLKRDADTSNDLYVKPPNTPRLERLLSPERKVDKCSKAWKIKDFFERNEKHMQRFRVTGKVEKGKTQGSAVQRVGSLPTSMRMTPSTSIDSVYKDRISLLPISTSSSLLNSPKRWPNVKIRPFQSPRQLGRLRL